MLAWTIRLASVVALTVLAYGWGDWLAERPAIDGILLGGLTVLLLVALARLYRVGGPAAFDFAEERRAPGEAIAETGPATLAAPSRAVRRREPAPEASPLRPPVRPRDPGGTLWSARRAAPLDLNAATADELARLPGIGRGAADRVVAHRDANGPFGSVAQLGGVEGFDALRVERVTGRLRV